MSFRDNPFDRMDRMMNEMNRRFGMMGPMSWGDWGMPALGDGESGQITSYGGSDLNLTVDRDDEGYTVYADTPGFERDELDVYFQNGSLRISGVHEDDEEGFHSQRFFDQVSLDGDVIEAEISAHYHNGVLEVRVPTRDGPEVLDEGRHIEIEG